MIKEVEGGGMRGRIKGIGEIEEGLIIVLD
jgi:hypothetical protein